jgi:hypothetical protein
MAGRFGAGIVCGFAPGAATFQGRSAAAIRISTSAAASATRPVRISLSKRRGSGPGCSQSRASRKAGTGCGIQTFGPSRSSCIRLFYVSYR